MSKIENVINRIKTYHIITDLDISYNIDTSSFKIFDGKKRMISDLTLSISEFQDFIYELSKLSLWNSDYEMELKVNKY